jgi:methionyl-tRNA synthetase
MTARFYVTTPIYYINDVPHLGTAYTTIAADVLARYQRLRGREAFFLTGTDEHGLKLERVAKEQKLEPKVFADTMSAPFRETWPRLECDYSAFVRTTDPDHERQVQEVWERVHKKGDLYLGSYEGWYCVGCEVYYTEKELEPGGVCPLHKVPAERIREPTYFFRLSAYADKLLALYESQPSFVMPTSRMNEVKSFVRGGLEDLSVSRTTFSWGIPVPQDPAHVMYVWFDALFSYMTPLATPPERRKFWPPNVHLVGKDILRFHAVYWPAFLMSAGIELPQHVFAHGFLTFNGQKMSKSLRNTVKPVALAEAFGVDTLRYYLMRAIAFGQDGDFSVKDLVTRYNSDLGNAFGNLLNRVLPQCVRLTDSKVPVMGPPGELETTLASELEAGARAAAEAFDTIQPHRALEAIWGILGAANQYVDRAAPWAAAKRGDQERVGTILATALETLEAVATLAWPVMPKSCDAVRAQLGLGPLTPATARDLWPSKLGAGSAGRALGTAAPLFPRIDAAREAELVQGLGLAGPAETPAGASSPEGAAVQKTAQPGAAAEGVGTATYDDFGKLDLRVGVVVAAERIAGKDKLLSLRVDLGEAEARPIVAGLALSFRPEDLVGTRVVVIANLEPRKFGKGLVSHGMLLAAGPSEALKLVTVDAAALPGTRVK